MSKVTAIVLAAGNGSRMKSDKKKQFMEIKGKPVIWYSLFAFERSLVDQIILVTGENDIEYCKKNIVEKYGFQKVNEIVAGGRERYESVYNGLKNASGDIVLIHDAARPLINNEIIERCVEGAERYGACVAGVPSKDTVKITKKDRIIDSTPDRNNVWITQTPQAFQYGIIKDAYDKIDDNCQINITDDAMVVEYFLSYPVRFVQGEYSNIKITTPEDIFITEALMKKIRKN